MTSTTLRPNATVSTNELVTLTGGSTAHEVTSDDSDSSYMTVLTPAGIAKLGLGTFTLPAGAVTKQIRCRLRGRNVVFAGKVKVRAVVAGVTYGQMTPTLSTTISDRTGSYAAITATQSEIDGTQIWVEELATAGWEDTRCMELYVDYVYVEQPTVTVVAPTSTETTSLVPVTWSYSQTDVDGGAQTHYQVKVFTDAVVNGVGFDPDTSDTIYDSGVVASSEQTHTTSALPDGTDHHVYVRAAETINGAQHWSDWDDSTFTVDTSPPAVDAITAVADNDTASITVTVDRDTNESEWTQVTVERSADSGATWEFVRGASQAAASGDTFEITDYEAPNGVDVVYRARGANDDQVGEWSSNSQATHWSSQRSWLKAQHPQNDLNTMVRIKEVPARARTRPAGVHTVLDASFPVVVTSRRTKAPWALVLQTIDDDEADAVDGILDAIGPLLLQPRPGLHLPDMWLAVLSDTVAHSVDTLHTATKTWQLQVVEVDRPPDLTE